MGGQYPSGPNGHDPHTDTFVEEVIDVAEGNGHARVLRVATGPTVWQFLWGRRFWILAIALLSGVITGAVFTRSPVLYHSSIVVHLSDPMSVASDPTAPLRRSPGIERLRLQATSSATLDGLIKVCELYPHYGLDTTVALRHEIATAKLVKNVEVTVIDANSLEITVHDFDRVMAARAANVLFTLLREAVAQQTERLYAQEVMLLRDMLHYQEDQSSKHRAEMLELVNTFNAFDAASGVKPPIDVGLRLMESNVRFEEANSQLRSMAQRVERMAVMNKSGQFGELTLINRGMLDISTQPRLTIIVAVLIAMLLMTIITGLMMVLWFREGPGAKDWFTQPLARH